MDGKKLVRSPAHAPEVPPGAALKATDELLRALIGQLALCTPDRLLLDPQNVTSDEIVMDVELDGYRYLLVRTPKSGRGHVELSPREKEIVRMVAQGHPNKIIADVLNISSWTVCTHLRRIFAKLGVGSRAAMVARMHEMGSIRAGVARPLPQPTATAAAPDGARGEANGVVGLPAKTQNMPAARRQSA